MAVMALLQRFDELRVTLELAHVQVVIETFLLEQLGMFAAFDDLAIVDNQHHIRIADGALADRFLSKVVESLENWGQ